MQRDGLVKRRPALDDSRAVEVWITAKGRTTLDSLMPHAEAFVNRMIRTLSDSEIKQMTNLLERLFSDLQEEP
jgi:DNA-binding MarR family transcriptional regulator